MLAYLNRFAFSFFLCVGIFLGCGSGVLQASDTSTTTALSVSGAPVVSLGAPVQYTASLTGTSATEVNWSIRGTSSSEDYGSISASGVYTPPAAVPVHNVISIVATSASNPTKSSATIVTILNPVPLVSGVSATPGYHSTFLVNVSGGNFLPSSIILYNGYGVATTHVSATSLQFTLSSAPPAGTVVPISVATPSPGKVISASYSFTVPPTVAVNIAGPAQATVNTPAQFQASLTGADNQSVTWRIAGASASENYGTISDSGVYTPPPTVPMHNTIAIIATSVVDTTKSATAATTLLNAVPAISAATLTAGAKNTFQVDIQGSNYMPTSYVQYLGYGIPTTVVSANEVRFTLSSPPPAGSSVSLMVVNPGTGKTKSAPFTAPIPGAVAVQVSGAVLVTPGKPAQYTASVTGASNLAVTWAITGASASESYGTISASGLYTPPPAVPVHNAISIVATSQADSTRTSSVAVTISNPVPVITSASLSTPTKGIYTIDVLGTNFMPTAALLYGGSSANTTYLASGHLQFTITNTPVPGTVVMLGVVNPGPGQTQSANFNLTIPGTGIAVVVTGENAVHSGTPVQYLAAVTGTSNTAVNWSLRGVSASDDYGTISDSGLYTPPAAAPIHPAVKIVATSKADATKSSSISLALLNAVPLISSATATANGKSLALSVTGSNFMPRTFLQFQGINLFTTYVSSNQLTATVSAAKLTAGAHAPVIAISPNPGMVQSASYAVLLPGQVGVTVVGATEVSAGTPAQYAATVTGTSNTAVNWSVTATNGGDPGTISSTGLYTPPATGGANLPVTISATSQEQPSISGSAPVTVVGVSVVAAGRLLDQSTFGPTEDLVSHVQTVGLSRFIDEQLAMPPSLLPLQSQFPAACAGNAYICTDEYWWANAVAGPDQLRQRVSMTLMEMLVVSYNEANTAMVGSYSNILTRDAFGNWATILKDITLSPAMGRYLNMANSGKPAPGAIANENFARENMQLFNTGLYLLNQDGTLQTDGSGNPIPTYTESQVEAFARVFTGWTYDTGTGVRPAFPTWSGSPYIPMVANEAMHDTSAKALLNTTLPAGQSAEQDLDAAIQDVFNHPNVGPFLSRQLIQHMVKSNPSPEYISRIAAVFANDGNGVRGNMGAVIKALLLDPEARAGDTAEAETDGYLREPILWTANILRAMNAVPKPGYNDYTAYTSIDTFANSQGQRVFNSPTVFNFYPAEWKLMNTGLNGPQFALEDTATIMQKLTLTSNFVNNLLGRLTIDLSATGRLGRMAVASNDVLLQELSKLFLHGQMPPQMRTTVMNAISGTSDPAQRVRTAVYLIVSSPQYRVIH